MTGQLSDSSLERLVETYCLRVDAGDDDALESLCAQHPEHAEELRQRVQLLDEFMGDPGPERSGPSGQDRIGRFELREPIGRGGMGVVFRAFDPEVGREVALKIMSAAAAMEPRQRDRFRREVRAVARLSHPGILPVYEVGDDGGTTFYVMELIDGRSLQVILSDLMESRIDVTTLSADDWKDLLALDSRGLEHRTAARLPETSSRDTSLSSTSDSHANTVARVGLRIAESLAHAHDAGIVHRDVKPGNIMLARDGRVLLLDFGLAQLEGDATLTATGNFLGTPYYAPPERVRGNEGEHDPRGDVYSLGITLYELLTFSRPFVGKSREQIFRQILSNDPATPRSLNSRIPPDLETIVLKSIEKDPHHRYPEARAMADDLERFLDGRPILARRANRLERLHKWTRREPILAWLAFGLVLATLLILVGNVWYGARLRSAGDALTERQRAAAQRAYELDMRLAAQAVEDVQWRDVERLLDAHRPEAGSRDLRGFEWHYLWNRGHDHVTFYETTPGVRAIALSPDAETLAIGNLNGEILLWNTTERRIESRKRVHDAAIFALEYAPNGSFLASGGSDRTVRVHATDLSSTEVTLGPFVESIKAIAISGSSRRLAMSIGNYTKNHGEVRVFETADWRQPYEPLVIRDPKSLEFITEDRLVTHAWLSLWTLNPSEGSIEEVERSGRLRILTFSHEPGHPLVSLGYSSPEAGQGEILVWDETLDGAKLVPIPNPTFLATDLRSSRVAIGVQSQIGVDRDAEAGIAVYESSTFRDPVILEGSNSIHAAFLTSRNELVSIEASGRLGVWDLQRRSPPSTYRLELAKCLSLSSDGKRLAASSNRGEVRVWDLETGDERLGLTVEPGMNTWISISPDGERIFAANYDELRCVVVETGETAWSVELEHKRRQLAISPSGRYLALSWKAHEGSGFGIEIRNTADGSLVRHLPWEARHVPTVAFAPDRDTLATAPSLDGGVYVWDDVAKGAPRRLGTSRIPLSAITFSNDGTRVATCGSVLTVWDVMTGESTVQLEVEPAATAIAFLADDTRLVYSNNWGRVVFLDTSTWNEVAVFQAHGGYMDSLISHPRQPLLVTGAFDHRIRVWRGEPTE